MIRILESKDVGRLLARRKARLQRAEETVRPILEDVRRRGDKALLEYARKLDKLEGNSVRISAGDLHRACLALPEGFRQAVARATTNIRAFAEMQLSAERWQEP